MSSWWKRYVRYEMYEKALRLSWKGPLGGWKEQRMKVLTFDENPPWSTAFKEQNKLGRRPMRKRETLVEPIPRQLVFKGDRVQILVGKDAGKQGIVNHLVNARNWCFVEGLNCKYEMTSRSTSAMPPTCMRVEKPLLVTKHVALVDPGDFKPTSVVWRYDEKGQRVRVSTRSGRIVPLPAGASEVDNEINPSTYVDSPEKDTGEKEALRVTFEPKMKTFEEDIMVENGIRDSRKKAATCWY